MSGSLAENPAGVPVHGEGIGRIAKAPPPEALQFTLRYFYIYISDERDIDRIGERKWM